MREKSEAQLFLEQPEKIDLLVKNKLIEQRQWRDVALSITANMNGEKVQSSGAKSKMADAVGRCVDLETEIDGLIDRLVDTKKEVIQAIEQLESPILYDILHRRYIQYQSLQEIADHYGKEYEWAKVNCNRARKHLQEILEKKRGEH